MNILETFQTDFARETATTRKHLVRLPVESFRWRPHAKSYTAGELALHLVECTRFTETICNNDHLDINASWKTFSASTPEELMAEYDSVVAAGVAGLARLSEKSLDEPWRFSIMQKTRFERPKAQVLRDFSLYHLIHHRGQFSVYLRLLDIQVPGTYGPTADEKF